jgi:SAM-dependent methyltransferase
MTDVDAGVHLDVVWHDIECGGYAEDLALWRALADAAGGGAILDVGAGTGRVSLDLAALGFDVVALDAEAPLLEALRERAAAAGVAVQTVAADARSFALGDRRFALIIVPMQTLQLLGGADGRAAFLRRARAHLVPGGLVAAALADALESFDSDADGLPEPDVGVIDGVRFASRPLAVVDEGERAAIHRLRQITGRDGTPAGESHDVIRLDRVTAAELAAEGEAAGFTVEASHPIPATEVYVGSTVVMLRAGREPAHGGGGGLDG